MDRAATLELWKNSPPSATGRERAWARCISPFFGSSVWTIDLVPSSNMPKAMPRITSSRMQDVIGRVPKPTSVWQRQFDGDDWALQELAQSDWNEISRSQLGCYFEDMNYQELQPDLFRHVFPACLRFWYETLMLNESGELHGTEFHHVMLHGRILEKMLTPDQRRRCCEFFRDGFLDRLDSERGFKYVRPGRSANAWIWRFNSIGLVAPVISEIWSRWWSMTSPGHAVSAIMYASGLIYLKGENPIYLPWTRDEGGGGPYLTEWDAVEFDHVWLDENRRFLASTLTSEYVADRVSLAARLLHDQPEAELARRVAADARERSDIVAIRIEDVLVNLGRRGLEKNRWD